MHLPHVAGGLDLCYCSNIHAGESWDEIAASLNHYIPLIKQHLAIPSRFGIGLRLSAQAAASLRQPQVLQAFQAQLAALDAYVFTLNAFPYGPFHGVPVKQQVYLPDWRDAARLAYTEDCAHILAALLPAGGNGSISTVPGGFRHGLNDAASRAPVVQHLLQAVAMLAQLESDTGKCIALALEPEPCCMLETSADTLAFFRTEIWSASALATLAKQLDTSSAEALRLLQRHLGVCYDVCHAAVEFEDPVASLIQLRDAGIAIPKIQLSCALQIDAMKPSLLPQLQGFDDGVYLHQVVVQKNGQLQRFVDLPDALAAYAEGQAEGEWRIHCHVPIFWEPQGVPASTKAALVASLQAIRSHGFSHHLEVETYTWDVLPPHLKQQSKAAAIARELAFVLTELQA